MNKRTIPLIVAGALLLYLPFSPVFLTSIYCTQPKSSFAGSDGYAHLFLHRPDSFHPRLFYGLWRFDFNGAVDLMFRSQSGELESITIATAELEIDGKKYPLEELEGNELQMDSSAFNRYGGNGSTGIIKFDLPQIPEETVRLNLEGSTTTSRKNSIPFSMTVQSNVVTEQSTMLLYQYFLAHLFAT